MRLCLYSLLATWLLLQPSYGDDVWNKDLKKAFESAQKNKKPVVLKFTATWCGTCTQMHKGPLADKGIRRSLKSLNAIALDVDQYKALTKRYRIQGLPTLLFMSPSGVIFKRTELFVKKDTLKTLLSKAEKESKAIEAELSKLKTAAQANPEEREALAKFFTKHENLEEAAQVYQTILKDTKIGAHPRQKAGIRAIDSYYRIEQFDKAIKAVEVTVKLNPYDALAGHALFLKGFVYEAQEKTAKAKSIYEGVVKNFAKSRSAKAAAGRLKELRGQK